MPVIVKKKGRLNHTQASKGYEIPHSFRVG